ncbi:MAG: response regulator [Calothrix sp. SM1_7_51]|nr:response regulator [Calothrix sp. SM1_7_51]
MKKLSSIAKLRAVFILAVIVIFINAAVSYSHTTRLIGNQQDVTHSHEVITQLGTTLSVFKDAETLAIKYLVTENKDYLEAYFATRKQMQTDINSLKLLTIDKPKQQQIFLLEQKINNRLGLLQEEMTINQSQPLAAVKNLIVSHHSQESIQDIQQLIQQLEDIEKKLLQKRVSQLRTSFHNAIATFTIAVLGDIALVTLLYFLLERYIKQRSSTELALRQSENRLRAMIDAEPECIKLIGQNGNLLEINTAGVKMLEVESADILLGKSVYPTIAPEYRSDYIDLHHQVCQGKKASLQFEMISFKGTRRWMETRAVPLRSALDGTFLHLAVTRDITIRKQQEHQIREQAALLDVATDAILVQDIQTRFYFGIKALNVFMVFCVVRFGKNASQLLYKDSNFEPQDAYSQVLHQGEWHGELHQLTKDGREIITESRWTLVKDEKGLPKSILTVNTEITQKKLIEAQLLRSQRLESIGTLAGGIAHDLNNVLTPILMSVQLLQMKTKDEQHSQILRTLENNAKRGANLVKQVLSFARGIEGKRTLVEIKQLIYEIQQIITETFPKSIVCQINISENLWQVWGDITQLHQVLMNLVVNARDAMLSGGTIKISAENFLIDKDYSQINIDARIGSYIVLTVADSGIGMSSDIQERIFEPFFTTKELGKGTGLGLSTAIGIIKNHNGFINVDSEVNKGTQFQVYLPASNNREVANIIVDTEPIAGNGELILVVDDEIAIREITKSSLESYNYRVMTAADGVEALAIYAQHKKEISLVILDIMMPTMDGLIAIRTLQKINPEVKIIAMSGLVSNHKIAEATGMGVQGFLAKPCTAKELLRKISIVKTSC